MKRVMHGWIRRTFLEYKETREKNFPIYYAIAYVKPERDEFKDYIRVKVTVETVGGKK
jgi:hypothetical protein